MAKLIQQGQFDYRIRGLAEEIVGGLFPHDYLSEYAAILNWVRKNVRYTRDPRTIEQIQTAAVTIEAKHGDCDDSSVVIGALVGTVGAQVRLVAGAFASSPKHPRNGQSLLSHVWLEAFEPAAGAWVVLDPVPGRKVNQMLGRLTRTVAMEVLQ
jgi:transglutaminase-like putative cysteine protease